MLQRLNILITGLRSGSAAFKSPKRLREIIHLLQAFERAGAHEINGWFRIVGHPTVGHLEWKITPGVFSDKLSLRHEKDDLLREEPLHEEPLVLREKPQALSKTA